MPSVCFYFQVHQPLRIKRYRIFDIGKDHSYFNGQGENDLNNHRILEKVSRKSYLPANRLLLSLLRKYPEFRVSFSLSGVLLEQLEEGFPEVLESFQELVKTKQVEILEETFYHSLAFLYSEKEFREQILLHRKAIKKFFGLEPAVFRNTELIYHNDIARIIEKMGYRGILAEGADHMLAWRSPNFIYRPQGTKKIALLLKNYKLSDDIAFRFSAQWWEEYPLTAEKYATWVSALNYDKEKNGPLLNLFMDYETFGEHQWEDKGIFQFLEALPGHLLKDPANDFVTPSEAISRHRPVGSLDVPYFVSWADVERDLSAWLSNPIQHDAAKTLYQMEPLVKATKDRRLLADWRHLQTSDHFYYMCTKWFADGDVHKYFNPYESPYDAFIAFMNVMQDMRLRITAHAKRKTKRRVLSLIA